MNENEVLSIGTKLAVDETDSLSPVDNSTISRSANVTTYADGKSPLDVIKNFMGYLDTTTDTGTTALDGAIKACSNFNSIQEAIDQMIADVGSASSATEFLSDKCDINLTNADTGAITGLDAGGSTTKDKYSIVPEYGSLDTSFTGDSFTASGLTFYLADLDVANNYQITEKEYSELTTDAERFIWRSFKTWWASGSLDLISASYGNNFGFGSKSSATTNTIYLAFVNDSNNTLATTWNWTSNGRVTKLAMTINMNYYSNISTSDPNGSSSTSGATYLDRTLAHEFTHAAMAANIDYFNDLPGFIKEGMAELTHGIDDERGSRISSLAGDATSLKAALNLDPKSAASVNTYAGGYMFLRYLAKQAAVTADTGSTETGKNISNSTSNTLITGSAYDDTVYNSGANVTVSVGAGDDRVENSGSKVTVLGGAGTDTIYNGHIDYSSIVMPNGDTVTVHSTGGTNLYVDGGDNADFIENGIYEYNSSTKTYSRSTKTANVTIHGGAGDDIINNFNSGVTIDGGADNDSVSNYGSKVAISGGTGDDTLKNHYGSKVTISGGTGDDYILNERSTDVYGKTASSPDSVSIDAGDGNDYISNYGRYVTITAGAGNDTIYNGYPTDDVGAHTTIDGGAGNDTIFNYGYDVLITDTLGANFVNTAGSSTTVITGAYNDTISGHNANQVINVGEGNNSISSSYANNSSLKAGAGNDTVSVYGSQYVTIDAGEGSNVIRNSGGDYLNVIIGGGNTTIYGFTANSTLQIDDGTGEYSRDTVNNNILISTNDGTATLIDAASIDFYVEGEEPVAVWSVNGTTATYGTSKKTFFTITGLRSGLTLNDDGEIDGITLDDETVYLTEDVLSTSTVSISGNYTLELDGVTDSPEESEVWAVSGTKIDYNSVASAYYSLSANNKSVTYTAAKTTATLAEITGVKSGLTVEEDGTIDGVTVSDDVIILSNDVLNGKTVTLTKGDYTLELDADVVEPEEETPAWTVSGTTAKLVSNVTAGYSLSEDGKSVTYTAAKKNSVLATITGLRSGLKAVDGEIDGISEEDGVIILSNDVLSGKAVKVTGDYTLAFDEDVAQDAEETSTWAVSGTTLNYNNVSSAYYTLAADNKSATYKAEKVLETLATLTGVKSGLKVDSDGEINGVTIEDGVITLTNDILNKKAVALTRGDYTLSLDEEVAESVVDNSKWAVSGTTAKFIANVSAGYSLAANGKSVSYTAAKKNSTLATVTGLKSGLKAVDGEIEGISEEDGVITLSNDVLSGKAVKVTGNYTLAFDDDVTQEPEETTTWASSGTTINYRNVNSAYYKLSTDAKSATYNAEKVANTIATLTGVKSGLKVNDDGTIDGVTIEDDVITLTSDVLNKKSVKLTKGDYTLYFGEDVRQEAEETSTWAVSGTTLTYKNVNSDYYTLASNEKSATYKAEKTISTLATLTGVKSGLTVNDDGTIDGISVEDDVITLSNDVLNKKAVTLKKGDYTIALEDDVTESTVESSKWTVSGTTAKFVANVTAGYTLAADEKSVNYTTAKKNSAIATITGLRSGLKAVDGEIEGISLEDGVITLSNDVLNSKTVKLTGNYILALGDDVRQESEEMETWIVSGTTINYKDVNSSYYALASNGKTLTYKAEKALSTLATITGLKNGLKVNSDGTIDGVMIDGDVITLTSDVLNKKPVKLTKGNYTLALDGVEEPEEESPVWSTSGTTATLKSNVSAGYTLSADGKSVAYSAAKKNSVLATVKGVATDLSDSDNIDVDSKTISLSGDDLNSKVTVSGSGWTFDFDADYSDATISGSSGVDYITASGDNISISGAAGADLIEVSGVGVTVNGGKGNDTISGGGTGENIFTYASGDGNDLITDYVTGDTIKLTSTGITPKFALDDEDIVVTLGSGKVTLEGAADQTVTVVDKTGKNTWTTSYSDGNISANASDYWFAESADAYEMETPIAEIIASTSDDSAIGKVLVATEEFNPTPDDKLPIITSNIEK